MLMDAVFGRQQFRNEITWQRTESHNTADRYGNVADILLYYSKSDKPTWNTQHQPYGTAQMSRFRHVDADGRRYKLENLTAPRPDSDSGKFEWRGTTPGPTRGWGYKREQLEAWWAEGRIQVKKDGTPRMDGLKNYLDEAEGKPLQNIWTDITRVSNTSSERVGYPTQKPLALLDRIIRTSSDEGDMVLDPFCGCATACVAADRLGRQWVGIDLSPLAGRLVETRMRREGALLFKAMRRDDIPQRTDVASLPNYRTHKHTLYGKQEGNCTGCRTHFPFRNLTIDHVVPQAKGGTNHSDNLQLLCGACNSMKGTGTQEELIAKLIAEGIRVA